MQRQMKKKENFVKRTIEKLRETISSVDNFTVTQIAQSHYKPMIGVLQGNLV